MTFRVLAEWYNEPWAIFIFIVLIFGILALCVFLFSKFVLNKNKVEEKPTEEELTKETLDRYLEEVDSPETQKQFDEYEKDKENK